jgi:hypothetical protein
MYYMVPTTQINMATGNISNNLNDIFGLLDSWSHLNRSGLVAMKFRS